MKFPSFLMLAMITLTTFSLAADPDSRVFEMRTYYAPAGKLDDLHARFRDHTLRLFEKHGMTNIGYWVPIENGQNKLIYILAYPSREAREASWKAFIADPDWKAAQGASEKHGKLVEKAEELYLKATDYSPPVAAKRGSAERIFELRTYTTTPGNLPALHARFRDHTMKLFEKHGMTNLFYWQPATDQENAENTLVYLLAHASVETAKKSFDTFRTDQDWIAARRASEEKAGGSLTTPDGVKSVLMKATDYSPTK